MQERDRAYHQGTVWAFPLGAYYRACIRLGTDKDELDRGILAVKDWLKEGCAAQIAEIYDGERPTVSRGCYAQAWSVCELLRAVAEYEKI
jgi:glycogen debranching enzyme